MIIQSAARLPILQGCGTWRRTIEHTNSLIALVRRRTFPISGDTLSGIVNLGRPKPTAGKCFSFLRSRVQACKQARGIKSILVSPNYRKALPLLVAHGNTMQQGASENAETCSGEIQNVYQC